MTVIIYLIGRSGTGKYTIAKEIEKYNFKVVDNHLINNPIFSLLDLNNMYTIPASAWEAIGQIRAGVFDFMSKEYRNNYVLTNELLEVEKDHHCFNQVQVMAARRDSLFVPVRLHLSKQENARRIQMPQRALRFKSMRINEAAYEKPLIQVSHPNLLDMDVTCLTAEVVAQRLMEATQKLLKKTFL